MSEHAHPRPINGWMILSPIEGSDPLAEVLAAAPDAQPAVGDVVVVNMGGLGIIELRDGRVLAHTSAAVAIVATTDPQPAEEPPADRDEVAKLRALLAEAQALASIPRDTIPQSALERVVEQLDDATSLLQSGIAKRGTPVGMSLIGESSALFAAALTIGRQHLVAADKHAPDPVEALDVAARFIARHDPGTVLDVAARIVGSRLGDLAEAAADPMVVSSASDMRSHLSQLQRAIRRAERGE